MNASQNMQHKDRDTKGWLRRKGGRMNTWSRRYCVLSDKFLFMYLKEDDNKFSDCITLNGQTIVEPPVDPNAESKRCYFDIISASNKSQVDVISLCADTEESKKDWIRALKRALYADKGGALFSQSLQEILYWERNENRRIPYIVDECVEYLYKYGLEVEGIFRLPGRLSAIKDIISRFEKGEKIKFEDENVDVHVVASVLKTFLRDLPDSIIPCQYFQKFMNIALRFMESNDVETKNRCAAELAEGMKVIPEDNYVILKYICRFLREVGLYEASNKMSMMSLGTVFGYNLIRHIDKENSQLFLCTADLGQNLVYMMLEYFPKVFMLEYSDKGDAGNNVPTSDLLRMSRVFDVPPVTPNVAAFKELEGIDFNYGTLTPPTSCSSKGSQSSLTNDLAPVPQPRHPLEADEGSDDVFNQPKVVLRKTRNNFSLDLPEPSDVGLPPSGPNSPSLKPGDHPVPPKRKSRILRNRNVSDRKYPDGGSLDGDRSPRSPMSPVVLDPEDVLTALSHANLPTGCQALSPAGSLKKSKKYTSENTSAVNGSTLVVNSVVSNKEISIGESLTDESGKVGPSTSDLHTQVNALKEELIAKRDHYKKQVNALKSQLTDIREKYERRIETMQIEIDTMKQEHEKNLSAEKAACAQAVAEIVELKEKLHNYRMQYGDL